MLSPSEKSKQSTWLACLINLSLQRHTNKRVTTTWYLKSCQLEFPDWWMLHRALTSRLRLPNEIVCPTDVPDSFCNWNWIPAEISYARKISINSVNFSAERIYGQLVHCTTRGETSELLGDTLPLRHPHAATPTASCEVVLPQNPPATAKIKVSIEPWKKCFKFCSEVVRLSLSCVGVLDCKQCITTFYRTLLFLPLVHRIDVICTFGCCDWGSLQVWKHQQNPLEFLFNWNSLWGLAVCKLWKTGPTKSEPFAVLLGCCTLTKHDFWVSYVSYVDNFSRMIQ